MNKNVDVLFSIYRYLRATVGNICNAEDDQKETRTATLWRESWGSWRHWWHSSRSLKDLLALHQETMPLLSRIKVNTLQHDWAHFLHECWYQTETLARTLQISPNWVVVDVPQLEKLNIRSVLSFVSRNRSTLGGPVLAWWASVSHSRSVIFSPVFHLLRGWHFGWKPGHFMQLLLRCTASPCPLVISVVLSSVAMHQGREKAKSICYHILPPPELWTLYGIETQLEAQQLQPSVATICFIEQIKSEICFWQIPMVLWVWLHLLLESLTSKRDFLRITARVILLLNPNHPRHTWRCKTLLPFHKVAF